MTTVNIVSSGNVVRIFLVGIAILIAKTTETTKSTKGTIFSKRIVLIITTISGATVITTTGS